MPCLLSAEDASVEIAICQCLLGRTSEALATLGVLEGSVNSNDSAPDSGILEFLQVRCTSVTTVTRSVILKVQESSRQGWVEVCDRKAAALHMIL